MFIYDDFYLMGTDSVSDFLNENDSNSWLETSYFNGKYGGGFNKNTGVGSFSDNRAGSVHDSHGSNGPSHTISGNINSRGGVSGNYGYKNGNVEVNAGGSIDSKKNIEVGVGGKIEF